MKNKRVIVARIVALLLVVIMVVSVMAAAFSVRAASEGGSTVLPKQEIYFQDRRLPVGKNYIVPKNGVLLVEKGVTLTIQGSLQVIGTLKNEGTIIITEVVQMEDQNEPLMTAGTLSNHGVIENKERIATINGGIYNYPRARFENMGVLELANTENQGSLFHNMVRPRGEYTDVSTLINTGKIIVKNIEGVGLYNHKGALVDNKEGTIILSETGVIRGSIDGNAPQRESDIAEIE